MWARVYNSKVTMVVNNLPKTFQGVSNFDSLPTSQLKTYGWYPFSVSIPPYDAVTHYVKSIGYQINTDDVVEVFDSYIKTNLTNPIKTTMSKLEFRSRFTINELIGIESALMSTETPVSQRAILKVLADNMAVASEIDVTDPRTIQGVQTLGSFGLLTSARVTEILTP